MIPTPLGARNPNVVRDWWSIVERNRVTIGGAVPTTLAAIMNVPRDGHDLSSLEVFVSGGSTVPVELIRRIETEVGVPVVEGYGMTEVHCYATMNPMHGEHRPGSVGFRLPYTEVRIADVAGDGTIRGDCLLGTIGHVLMRGPQVTPGYLDPRHDKGAMLADAWLDSGDLGRLDADGYVWLTGRSKDLIIRGGHNIDPIVIEEALVRHPAVETAAAVGLPDTYAGELPMAFVQLKPNATATSEELREFCRQQIPERAAVPVQVVPIPTMPLTGVGKIFKPALRLEAAQRAFDAALMPLRADGVTAEVKVGNDPTHGTLATVRVTGAMMAEHLTAQGHQVTVVDREKAGLGSTAASTAMLQWEIDCSLAELDRTVRLRTRCRHLSPQSAGSKRIAGFDPQPRYSLRLPYARLALHRRRHRRGRDRAEDRARSAPAGRLAGLLPRSSQAAG